MVNRKGGITIEYEFKKSCVVDAYCNGYITCVDIQYHIFEKVMKFISEIKSRCKPSYKVFLILTKKLM